MFDGIAPVPVLFFVGIESWPAFAERVRPHLEKMAKGSGGRFLLEDIEVSVSLGRMQLWVVLDGAEIVAALVTEMAIYPRSRALRCIGIVGHRPRRWTHLLALVEQIARVNLGCDRMEAMHQPGHERMLTTGGWTTWHWLSEKML